MSGMIPFQGGWCPDWLPGAINRAHLDGVTVPAWMYPGVPTTGFIQEWWNLSYLPSRVKVKTSLGTFNENDGISIARLLESENGVLVS